MSTNSTTNKINLSIYTPQGKFYSKDVYLVTVKINDGYIGILKNHVPFISAIEISKLFIKEEINHKDKILAIGGGIIYVDKEFVDIFSDDIKWKDDLNRSEVEQKIESIQNKIKIEQDLKTKTNLQISLEKEMNKLVILNGKE